MLHKTTFELEQEIVTLNMQIDAYAKVSYEKELRIAELEAQLNKALSQLAEVPRWLPIENAPKDGSEVLLWLPAPYNRMEKARWFDLWENWQLGDFPDDSDEYCGIGSALPTHYMSIPADPAPSEML